MVRNQEREREKETSLRLTSRSLSVTHELRPHVYRMRHHCFASFIIYRLRYYYLLVIDMVFIFVDVVECISQIRTHFLLHRVCTAIS
jgi:hypothetical protein